MLRLIAYSLLLTCITFSHAYPFVIANLTDEGLHFSLSANCESEPLAVDYPCLPGEVYKHASLIDRLKLKGAHGTWDGFIRLTVTGTTCTTFWILYEPQYGSIAEAQAHSHIPLITTHTAADGVVNHTMMVRTQAGELIPERGTILPDADRFKIVIAVDPSLSSPPIPKTDTPLDDALAATSSFLRACLPDTINQYVPGGYKHYLISIAAIADDEHNEYFPDEEVEGCVVVRTRRSRFAGSPTMPNCPEDPRDPHTVTSPSTARGTSPAAGRST